MRKSSLIILVLVLNLASSLPAQQSLILSFEACHYQGESIGLDSILIKNINRDCDTMLYAPDTVLYYNFFVGLDEKINPGNSFVSAAYPNPAENSKSFFNINLNKPGTLNIELFNLMGRKLFARNETLSRGNYKYRVNLATRGTYILRAIFENDYSSLKIVSNSLSRGSNFNIDLISETLSNKVKNAQTGGGFWYEPGDTLWYVGYAQTPYGIAGSDVLEGIPINKEHRRFIIVEGMPCPDNVAVKYAGHLYPTVQINDQCWFKENLNVGKMIPGVNNMSDDGIIEKYCYDNNLDNCDEYGGLYQWHELMNYNEPEATRGICPVGWHIPTSDECFAIIEDIDGLGCKERGNEHWSPGYNVGGNNTKGYTVLGSGYRQNTTFFEQLKTISVYYSSTKLTYDWVWYMEFNKNNHLGYGTALKITGLSVRCIKD